MEFSTEAHSDNDSRSVHRTTRSKPPQAPLHSVLTYLSHTVSFSRYNIVHLSTSQFRCEVRLFVVVFVLSSRRSFSLFGSSSSSSRSRSSSGRPTSAVRRPRCNHIRLDQIVNQRMSVYLCPGGRRRLQSLACQRRRPPRRSVRYNKNLDYIRARYCIAVAPSA